MVDYSDPDPKKVKFKRFAHGLHEILGLAPKRRLALRRPPPRRHAHQGQQRRRQGRRLRSRRPGLGNLRRLHEYAFGSKFDKDGNLWVALCLTGSFTSDAKFRGWAGKITPEGKFVPTTSGVRSPGGVGFNAEGDVFYTIIKGRGTARAR